MITASPEVVVFTIGGVLILALALGLPIGFAMAGSGMLATVIFWPAGFSVIVPNAYSVMISQGLIALPLFIFMSVALEGSGVAENLFKAMRLFSGRLPGGLAIAVILACTVIAAMVGTSATGVITMGILALPLMLKSGYNKDMAIGPIMAGGALGFLIPPSGVFILYGMYVMVSVGQLFAAGIMPGLMLSLLYMVYIGVRCFVKPQLGPPLPPEETVSWGKKFASLKELVLPGLLIIAVLGSIFTGLASPTESAAIGAAGSLVCAAINRRLGRSLMAKVLKDTFSISASLMWIMIGAFCFKAVLASTGGVTLIGDFITGLGLNPWMILTGMLVTFLILGCFMDEISYMMLTFPVFIPIITSLNFDLIWFGVVFLMTAEIACLTPPFGFALFVMKSVAPPEVTLRDIWHSVSPFVAIQLIGLILVVMFPQISLWLPNLLFG